MIKKEKKIKSELMFKGKVLSLYKDEVLCPNGEVSYREIIGHHGGVAILCKIDNKFIMEKQYRYGVDEVILEVPAGKLEQGETPLESAKRELLEETGYRPKELIYLGEIYPTVGYSRETITIYYCDEVIKEERHLDKDEFIDIEMMSLKEIEMAIKKGEIKDAKTIAGFSLYQLHFLK